MRHTCAEPSCWLSAAASSCVCVFLCPAQVGIYQVLYLNRSPEDAYAPLAPKGPYMPFRDASCGIPTFNLQPIDCIRVCHAASAGATTITCRAAAAGMHSPTPLRQQQVYSGALLHAC
jgi:hypothetical protein